MTRATPPPPSCVLGTPARAVMGIMGWSNAGMAARYQHITGAIRRDVARQVGGLLWPDNPPRGPELP